MKSKAFTVSFAVVLLSLCVPGRARANTVALHFTGDAGSEQFVDMGDTIGWSFTVSQLISVTNLGVWDGSVPPGVPGDGLASNHKISIWTEAGALIATTVIPAGTSTSLVDDFRYVPIAPTQLTPGTYVIGSYWNDLHFPQDPDALATAPPTTATGITYGGSRFSSGDVFPSELGGQFPGIFGPNFQFTQSGVNVPEVGKTLSLLTGSLTMLLALRAVISRRRQLSA